MYRKDIITKSIGLSAAITASVLLVMASSGVVNAALISGVGGFMLQADTINASNTQIYVSSAPVTGGSVSQYPVLNLELDATEIENLRLMKRVDNPLGLGGEARIVVTQQAGSTVTTGQLLLRSSSFNASGSAFRGLQIRENATTDPSYEFNITGGRNASDIENIGPRTAQFITINRPARGTPGVTITDANIRGHYLVAEKLTVQQLVVGVEYYDSNGNQITTL